MVFVTRRPPLFLLLAILWTGVGPDLAVGQSPDSTIVELPEVTVEAIRGAETEASAPFAVTVRSRSPAEVSLTASTSLDDVLRPLPGVWVNDRHHFALGERISVRGVGYRSNFGVRGVQVLYDGIPLTLPDGQAFLDVVEPAVVRQVELVRSPASVFWGNGSGGVLFLSSSGTAPPPNRIRVQGGSYGQWQGLAEGGGTVGPWTVHGYASGQRQEGYRAHSQGYRVRAGGTARRALGPDTRLRIVAAADQQDTENPSSLTREQFNDDPSQARAAFVDVNAGKQSSQVQLGASIDHDLGGATLSGTAYGLRRALDNPLNFAFVRYTRWSGGTRFTLRRTEGRLQGGLGVDAGIQSDDRIEFTSTTPDGNPGPEVGLDQLETVLNGSAFGYARLNATDRLALTGGLRLDQMRFEADDGLTKDGDQSGTRTFSSVSPSFGLSFDAGPAQVFAQYSTAFETPTASELSNRPGGGGGFNQQVEPQFTRGFEIGARGAFPEARLQFDVALYRLEVDDLISAYEDADGRDVYDNLAANTHDGIEASFTWQATDALEVATRYTGSRFVIDESNDDSLVGNRVPGIPGRRLYLHTEFSHDGWWGRISGQGVPSYYTNNANTAEAPRYVLVNLNLGHRGIDMTGLTLKPFVTVNNVLNERYAGSVVVNAFGGRYYEPAPERSFSAGLNVEW
ncbi:TonB-dependent receptor family protein [Salinibacter ruber]|uniref:TonB-dependent receptor family protein n=1 Tax=Salinibacter ruber TaxID=146919 RepID=UPI002169A1A1|nr:TonB-dependent receptor [Salinibacter ruber]MCS3610747.1 iron complex outermembrane receptor protein [Salinibacter ruber]